MGQLRYVPLNRHVLLEDADLREEGSPTVLVPDDYKVIKNFGTYRVVESAIDCDIYFQDGELVVVEENMVREVEVPGDKRYYILPENLVILRVTESPAQQSNGNPFNED